MTVARTGRDIAAVSAWAMVPTPFSADVSRVDIRSLSRLAESVIERGCSGLIALGVIAEPSTLTLDEKVLCLVTLASAAPHTPLVAGVMSLDANAASAEAEVLTGALGPRLAGFMVPISHQNPAAVREHLDAVHGSTGRELILQDLPSATGIVIDVDDLAIAIDGLDYVVAIKCESPPVFSRIARLRELGEHTLISGLGGLTIVDDVVSGATSVAVGVTPTTSVVQAFEAARRGEFDSASAAIGERAALINFEIQPGRSIAIRKEHWRRQGLIAHGTVRSPTQPYSSELEKHSLAHSVTDMS